MPFLDHLEELRWRVLYSLLAIVVAVVCEDDEHLLRLVDESVRPIPGVRSTEIFMYLKVAKESYSWGTR